MRRRVVCLCFLMLFMCAGKAYAKEQYIKDLNMYITVPDSAKVLVRGDGEFSDGGEDVYFEATLDDGVKILVRMTDSGVRKFNLRRYGVDTIKSFAALFGAEDSQVSVYGSERSRYLVSESETGDRMEYLTVVDGRYMRIEMTADGKKLDSDDKQTLLEAAESAKYFEILSKKTLRIRMAIALVIAAVGIYCVVSLFRMRFPESESTPREDGYVSRAIRIADIPDEVLDPRVAVHILDEDEGYSMRVLPVSQFLFDYNKYKDEQGAVYLWSYKIRGIAQKKVMTKSEWLQKKREFDEKSFTNE